MEMYNQKRKLKYNPLEKRQRQLTEEERKRKAKRIRRIKKLESIRNFFILIGVGIIILYVIYLILKSKGVF